MLRHLLNDEGGMILSAELVLILTIGVLSLIVGLSEISVAIVTELNDCSNAFGSLNQSYAYTGFHCSGFCKLKAFIVGSCFIDIIDDCDINTSCEIVAGAITTNTIEGGLNGHW